jgi:hypothetical protein
MQLELLLIGLTPWDAGGASRRIYSGVSSRKALVQINMVSPYPLWWAYQAGLSICQAENSQKPKVRISVFNHGYHGYHGC